MVIVWFRLLTSCIICYFTCLQDIIKLPWHKMGSGKTFFSELYISMPKKSLRAKRDSPAPGDSPGEKQQGRGWSRGCAPMLSWSLQQYCLRCTLLWPLSSSAEGLALMFYGLSITPVLLTVKTDVETNQMVFFKYNFRSVAAWPNFQHSSTRVSGVEVATEKEKMLKYLGRQKLTKYE